jgi:2-polyprenyl-3-methyl-5-hydroxy-6-metoxy-1,4-benzoquinol methylase
LKRRFLSNKAEQNETKRESTGQQKDIGNFFDDYAEIWDGFYENIDGRSFDYLNRQRVLFDLFSKYVPLPSNVLEMGCGSGHTAVELCRRGYVVTCSDVSAKMIEIARRNFDDAKQKAFGFINGTVFDVTNTNPYQAIFGMGVMDYVEDVPATIFRIKELLTSGGYCILSFSNANTPFRWIEMPIKRVFALGTYLVSRNQRYSDIALRASSAHPIKFVKELYDNVGFELVELAFFSYGIRMDKYWCPPLKIVKSLDKRLNSGVLRSWGRGFIAVGRKP